MDIEAVDRALYEASGADAKALPKQLDAWRSFQTDISYELGGFTPVGTETILQQLAGLQSGYARALTRVVDQMATVPGAGTQWNKFRLETERLMRKTFAKAYRLGANFTGNQAYVKEGLTAADIRFIHKAAKAEMNFFKQFAVKTLTHTPRMPRQLQTRMYVDSIRAQFWNGFVAATPDSTLIYWKLGTVRHAHCPDCLAIYAGSPYTKETLPSVPGAGHTRCLTNCRCRLWIPTHRGAGGEAEMMRGGFPPSATVTLSDGTSVTGAVAELFEGLYDEINRFRQLIELTSGEVKLNYVQLHRELVKQVIELQAQYGVRVVPTYSVSELVKVVGSLQEQGLEVFLESRGLVAGQPVWTVNNLLIRSGELVRVVDANTVVMRYRGAEITVKLNESIVMGRAKPTWAPFMSEEEATRFASGSAITDTLFHTTRVGSANNIIKTGFDPQFIGSGIDRGVTGFSGRGFYLSLDQKWTRGYGLPVELHVKVNVRKVADVGVWGDTLDAMRMKYPQKDSWQIVEVATEEIKRRGYDAILVGKELVVFDPKNIVVYKVEKLP